VNAASAQYRGLRSVIERITLEGKSSSEVGNWIQEWKKLRADGWDVEVLVEERQSRGRRTVVALVGMAYKPGAERSARGQFSRPAPGKTAG
jgi:hypothetical protein